MSSSCTATTGAAEQASGERQIDRSPAAVERYGMILGLIEKNTRPDTILTKLPWCTGRMIEDAKAYRTQTPVVTRRPLLIPPQPAPAPVARAAPVEKPAENTAKAPKKAPAKKNISRADRVLLNRLQSRIDNPLQSSSPAANDVQSARATPVGAPLATVVQTDAARAEKIETVIAAASSSYHLNKQQFKTRIGLSHPDAVIGAILLVLEFRGVASFHVVKRLGCTDAMAQEVLLGARDKLYDSTSQLYHHTRVLCEKLGITFGDLQEKCE